MKEFFEYNWQKRNEWFEWCKQFSEEELLQERTGGMKSILRTLFHIVDVEQRWVSRLKSEEEIRYDFDNYKDLKKLREWSDREMEKVSEFIDSMSQDVLKKEVMFKTRSGNVIPCKGKEVLEHMIAHEIHHTGQLSIWARELGYEPVSANLIGRGLY